MIACLRMGSLLTAALAGRASEAERLAIEDHLEWCERCRAEHASLSVVRRVKQWEPPRLSDLSRERARRAIVAAGTQAAPRVAPSRKWGRAVAGGLFGAAALAAIALLFVVQQRDRVVAGEIAVDGASRAAIGRDASLSSATGGTILVGGATVELSTETEIAWHREARTVELKRGAVTVDVIPGRAQHFRVTTARFIVEVVGTHFTVEDDRVRTERGTVRVLSPSGTLLATVAAGQSWRAPDQPPPPIAAAPTDPPPVAAKDAAPSIDLPPIGAKGTASSSDLAPVGAKGTASSIDLAPVGAKGTAPSIDLPPVAQRASVSRGARAVDATARDQIAGARRALSAGHAGLARKLLAPSLRAGGDAAEARSLLAESYLVEARYAEAIVAYRAVAADFDGTSQAESALFAIAQLETERARPDDAARALARYLARYPNGRFARDARRRLQQLTP